MKTINVIIYIIYFAGIFAFSIGLGTYYDSPATAWITLGIGFIGTALVVGILEYIKQFFN